MMSSQFSLFSLIAAVFLILVATEQFQPVKAATLGESIDSVGVMNPDAAEIETLRAAEYPVLQRRLKRRSSWSTCDLGQWVCINSCYYQDCSGGYCSSGICRCVRCT
jgi:hypothetical protein